MLKMQHLQQLYLKNKTKIKLKANPNLMRRRRAKRRGPQRKRK